MPFGCVASGAIVKEYGTGTRKAFVSNAFRLCGFWCLKMLITNGVFNKLGLQCLSAVWLLVPKSKGLEWPTVHLRLQCLSAVWLLVPTLAIMAAVNALLGLQCLSAVWLLVPFHPGLSITPPSC